jgi:hypothetical protein
VRRGFYLCRDNRLWLGINHTLLMTSREAQSREASPSAEVFDSYNIKTTESAGPQGYDAGRKIKGRKRHVLTDIEGNLVHLVIPTADIQNRDGAPLVLTEIVKRFHGGGMCSPMAAMPETNPRMLCAASANGSSS